MKKYYSDKSGVRIPEIEASVMKINRGSPLHDRFREIHLSHDEATELATWLGDRPDGAKAIADGKATGPKRPAPRSEPSPTARNRVPDSHMIPDVPLPPTDGPSRVPGQPADIDPRHPAFQPPPPPSREERLAMGRPDLAAQF